MFYPKLPNNYYDDDPGSPPAIDMLANTLIPNITNLCSKIYHTIYTPNLRNRTRRVLKYLHDDPSVVVSYPGPSDETALDEENGGREPGDDGMYQLFDPNELDLLSQ